MLRAHAGRRMRVVSLEVAEHALREHIARTGDDLTPYRVTTCRGFFAAAREPEFEDMSDVRDEICMRAKRMVNVNRAFRLQSWLAAERMIAERWPQHQSFTVSRDMLSGLDYEGLRLFPFGRRRGRKQTG